MESFSADADPLSRPRCSRPGCHKRTEAVGTHHGIFKIPAVDASQRRTHAARDLARIGEAFKDGLIPDQQSAASMARHAHLLPQSGCRCRGAAQAFGRASVGGSLRGTHRLLQGNSGRDALRGKPESIICGALPPQDLPREHSVPQRCVQNCSKLLRLNPASSRGRSQSWRTMLRRELCTFRPPPL
jgi:hypothetical protein